MLETLQLDKAKVSKPQQLGTAQKRAVAAVATKFKVEKCLFCKKAEHRIYHCPAFLNLPPQVRNKEVKELKVCPNCLKEEHAIEKCKFGVCRLCQKKHNSLLHSNKGDPTGSDSVNRSCNSQEASPQPVGSQTATLTSCVPRSSERGLLATAIIKIQDALGQFHECRAFLDPGSQTNFITRDLCNNLQLPQQSSHLSVRGIDNTQTIVSSQTHATIQSRFNAFQVKLHFSVLPVITTILPLSEINKRHLKIPQTITLADPSFHIPGRIDVLLGSAVFWDLLCVGQIKLGRNQPVTQKTKLGWIIAGPIDPRNSSIAFPCVSSNSDTLGDQLERFWHVEGGAVYNEPSENDRICEEEFKQTHRRNPDGRFEVRLPLRGNVEQLGSSRENAVKRLKSMERRFVKYPKLRAGYQDFMQDYQDSGHMNEVMSKEESEVVNYLPHHSLSVVKEDGITTKLRVVFYGSSATSSGVALNDILRAGPTIQQDLLCILLRFRQCQYVVTADIRKIYRQILLHEEQRDLQRIVWRIDAGDPVREYRLNTLTYGLTSSPFLATRCLLQFTTDNLEQYPEASDIIRNDFYIDDLLTGGNDIKTLRRLKTELTEILSSAGFQLHKWNTNEPAILDGSSDATTLTIGGGIKTLGVCWNSTDDCLQYRTQAVTMRDRATKRSVLSTIAQIYDPLGLMGPTIVRAKMILQQLWRLKIGWDESLPLDLHTTWMQYQGRINDMSLISIPRPVICSAPRRIEMHGFCDASEAAYGACIYIRSINEAAQISSHLLCAKSRVAPLKKVTLPRLELCGALLLTKLGQTVRQALSGGRNTAVAFDAQWLHVRSKDNTADVLSRGASPEVLGTFRLWWDGPPWMTMDRRQWPNEFSSLPESQIPELKRQAVTRNTLTKQLRESGQLTVEELEEATARLIQIVQSEEFAPEKMDLQTKGQVATKSKLVTLNPFMDAKEIVRFHLGPQGLLAHLRQLYWIISGKQAIRRVLRKCITCYRVRPITQNKLMGDLPKNRVNPSRAFLHSGLDYAGPFNIKISRNKGGKAYLCIFVCFSTKATHLEIVSDLSTNAFLNALKRFIARRGRCATLCSDNGTNFVGANNELKALANMIKTEHGKIERFLSDQNIQWSFIPSYSPHIRGLWEAAVKSAKTHLKRVIGDTLLTFEELGTIFAQIEAGRIPFGH
ncbi:PREDICTED: uncharacterized protein LOC105556532, partial [Vollenhovia emeryi]|uniref:uncharacterized protein LOC105556532 n=1 Tax=Vollenhovia emeryi TaxID=411798 RepID=UPI0005F4CC9E